MIKRSATSTVAIMVAASSLLAGCSAIKGLFKAGVWVGVIAAVVVIALVVGLGRAFSRS